MGGSKPFNEKSGKPERPERARSVDRPEDDKAHSAATSMEDKAEQSAMHTSRKQNRNKRFGHN